MLFLLSTLIRRAVFAPGHHDRFEREPGSSAPVLRLDAATIASLVFGAVFVAGGVVSVAAMLLVWCMRWTGLAG